MDIADIATREFVEVDAGKRLGKVRSIFERENPKGIIVTDDGEYAGVITQKHSSSLTSRTTPRPAR